MKELNQAVYYTTAQVTELVELSDQNVRKYVRLLEDRKYEVAKDEHNRRLFSANDILILRELIKKAKKPGYTLESAADEIINEISEIISGASHKVTSNNDNNEIKEMFSHVMERLDAIQEENRDLKYNIRNLVERLERYDQNDAQRYIEYNGQQESNNEVNQVKNDGTYTGKASENVESINDNDVESSVANNDVNIKDDDITDDTKMKSNEEVHSGSSDIEETTDAPSVSEVPGQKNVDMSAYSNSGEPYEEPDERTEQEKNDEINNDKDEKSGFLGGIFKMFRK